MRTPIRDEHQRSARPREKTQSTWNLSKGGVWLTTLAAIVLLLATCRPSDETTEANKPTDEPIRVGAIFSLTGNAAAYGTRAKKGIDLAIEQENSDNEIGPRFEVIYEDDKGDPREGVTAINKLISVDQVPVILGPQISGVAMAVAPVAQRNEVVLVLPGANTPELDEAGSYIFRVMPSSSQDGQKAATVVKKTLGIDRVAVTYPRNAGSTGIARAFIETYEELGGSIVVELPYAEDETNFRTIAQRIHSAQVPLVYAPGYNTDTGLLIRQSREVGIAHL